MIIAQQDVVSDRNIALGSIPKGRSYLWLERTS